MKCSSCGAELEEGVRFCKECGAKVETKKITFCRECGNALSEGSRFCSKCGADAYSVNNEIQFEEEPVKGKRRITNPNSSQMRGDLYNAVNDKMQAVANKLTDSVYGLSDKLSSGTGTKTSQTKNNNKTALLGMVGLLFILLLLLMISTNENSEDSSQSSTRTNMTIAEPSVEYGNLAIELGNQYAYMSDEWDVYIAEGVTDSAIKVEKWHKTSSSDKKVKFKEDIGTFKINDEENGFAWIDDEHIAFTLNLDDKNNSKVNGQKVIFTININSNDKNKGSNYDEKIACYFYQNDNWHYYRAIPLVENWIKIETWYRSSSSDKFLFGYDMCVLDTESSDIDFEMNSDETAFTITLIDSENNSHWNEETFVSFMLENEDYKYSDVYSYLNKHQRKKNETMQQEVDNSLETEITQVEESISVEKTKEEIKETEDSKEQDNTTEIVKDEVKHNEINNEKLVPKEKDEDKIPSMSGTKLDAVVKSMKVYGLTEVYDDDYDHGTRMKVMADSSGGLMIDIVYVESTEEIMCASIVTNNLASDEEQKKFVKGIAGVVCPINDANEVSKWVGSNIGTEAEKEINGFTYVLSLGPVDNIIYYAGEYEWENWESKQN